MPTTFSERRTRVAGSLLAACALTAFGGGLPIAAAQAQQIAQSDEARRRELERSAATQEQVRSATDAASLTPDLSEPATFEQVMASPDDPLLNTRYARGQVLAGDLQGAATTLERVLRSVPQASAARLLYAIVLFRLDMLVEAEREFDVLLTGDLPASERTEVGRYKSLIAQRRQALVTTVTATTGLHFDTNRNAASDREEILAFGAPISRGTGKNGDMGWLSVLSADITYDLGEQRAHRLIGGVSLVRDEQNEERTLDLSAISGEVGGVIVTSYGDLTATLTGGSVRLDEQPYQSSVGARLAFDMPVTADLTLSAGLRAAYEHHHGSDGNLSNEGRTGPKWSANLGARYALTPQLSLGASYTFTDKYAKEGSSAFDGHGRGRHNEYYANALGVSATYVMQRGIFFIGSADAERREYREPDAFVHPSRKRKDDTLTFRLTTGVPVGAIPGGDQLPAELRDVTFLLGAEYLAQYSSLRNYSYENIKYQFLISKSFRF